MTWSEFPAAAPASFRCVAVHLQWTGSPGPPKFMNPLLPTCRSLRPGGRRRTRIASVVLPPSPYYLGRRRPQLKRFRGEAHSSHRFGLFARTASALTRQLPFSSGSALHLCLLDSKVVIFASHKLRSRFLAHDSPFKRHFSQCRCRSRGVMPAGTCISIERGNCAIQNLIAEFESKRRKPRSVCENRK